MVVALVMVFLLGNAIRVSSLAMIAAAFWGAMLSMGFVLIISRKVSSMSMLVVSGVMIGYICSAVTEFVVTFADDSDIVNLHNWSRGSFSGMTWDSVGVMSIVVGITFIFVFLMSKPLMAYQLGESYAVNLGVNIKRIRVLLVLLSSLLSACIVAFAGPISFVGIAVPHIVKSMLKSTKPIYMIPACFLGGAVFCLFCDLLARMMFAPTELSISTVTAVFGAPVVLFIMIRRSKEKNSLMEYYFTAQKLAVGYDNRPLIENIDFSLKRGEILTLVGPNGAGKSTILKSIARQLSLVSGTIYLDKSDVVTMNGNEFAKKNGCCAHR